jgi:hypothetical protein
VDLSPFYETTATLSPVLLGGTAFAYRHRPPPRTRLGSAAFGILVLIPPLVVTLYSLSVLAGFSSAETWRAPVLGLLFLQLITGMAGLGEFVVADKEQRALIARVRKARREQCRLERRQPHSQPHKPERTGSDETTQPEPADAPDRTKPDLNEPEATGGRHS